MGDLSAEPSMEDILASIKRVIKEGEAPSSRRPQRVAPEPRQDDEAVLELDATMAPPEPVQHPYAPAPQAPTHRPSAVAQAAAAAQTAAAHAEQRLAAATPSAPSPDPASVSPATVEATRGALDSLSRLVVKPEANSDGTLEGMVREMLRPMLSDWLDRNLPALVEQMVAREIAKITALPR